MTLIEGIAVSGELVDSLEDKSFTVVKAPHYTEVKDLSNPDKALRKLVMEVRLSEGKELEYMPNKTSQKTMTDLYGFEMDNWIGKKFLWTISNQIVMGNTKKVLFVLDKRFKSEK